MARQHHLFQKHLLFGGKVVESFTVDVFEMDRKRLAVCAHFLQS